VSQDWLAYFRSDGLDNFPLFIYNYYSFREPIIGHIRKHVPPNGSIVEAGCGTGLTSILLSSMGYDVLGFDKFEEVADLARRNNERLGGRAKITTMDLLEANDRITKAFDLSYSYGLVEHFESAKIVEAMKALGRLARKVLVVVPTHDDPLVTGQRTFNFSELEELCKKAGLSPIDRFGVGTGLIKWPKLLLPPIILKRMLGGWIKCENIGMVCESPQSASHST
jgi:SAM-dependent methyltransferase